MTETYQHTFASGRVCTVRVRYRKGQVPVLRCTNPRGDFTLEEFPEYVEWRKLVVAQTLRNLDPIAIAKLEMSDEDETIK
jgi:hypothetical protein